MNQVTKQKHPGRQASGKKLVEWNKKNKEALLKNQKQPESSEGQEPNQELNQEPTSQVPSMILGILTIVGAGGAAYYFYNQQKPAAAPAPKKAKIYME